MSLSAVFDGIFNTISFIEFFLGLGVANAPTVITLEDIGRIVRTELSTFFRDLEITDLQTTRTNFYSIWLPSVTSRTTITAVDVNTGALSTTFSNLINGIALTQRSLNRLETIYRQNSDVFHIDDTIQGVHLFSQMYALLFHMHSVYGTLRRISLNLPTLDHPDLLPDTFAARTYATSATTAINWMTILVYERRFESEAFTPVLERWSGSVSYRQQWYYEDRYQSLSSTPQANRITVTTPAAYHSETVWNETSAVVRARVVALRAQRYTGLVTSFQNVISIPFGPIFESINHFNNVTMADRQRVQQQGRIQNSLSAASFIESRLATLAPPKDLVISSNHPPEGGVNTEKTVLVLPVDVEEYKALSEYLYITTSGKGSPNDDVNVDIGVANSTEAFQVCVNCRSTLFPAAAHLPVPA